MITKEIKKWRLNSYYPYVPILTNSLETKNEMMANMDWIEAEVPGSIYKDLMRANIIPDPYFELNSLQCEWVSQRWWMYIAGFDVSPEYKGRKLRLNLTGIDYKAHISLNGKKLGDHEGMFIPFKADITDIVDFENENQLIVLLEHAPDEMGQIGYTSRTFTQKARFTYRWDFCARLIHLGLYDKALIEDFGSCSIEEAYIRPVENADKSYKVECDLSLQGYTAGKAEVNYTLLYDGKAVDTVTQTLDIKEGENKINAVLNVKNPELWWPLGHGKQPLYKLVVTVKDADKVSDSKEYTVGLRKIEFMQNEDSVKDSLPYTIVINGKKIFLKGINIAPIDQIYGGLSYEDYDKLLTNAKNANINFIRVNGVGFIESEYLYELCDKYGIMVWQDFIQSSSGIDNLPSVIPSFLELLKKVAEYAIKVKRNHVSLSMWCGGNELREYYCQNDPPVSYKNENIAMLNNLVKLYDKDRIMLPSTASGPNEFLNYNEKGTSHDVHGPWKYNGTTEHYKLYNTSDALFHSEFGTEAFTNYSALGKFLSKEQIKVQPFAYSRVWKNHGDWWCTYDRDRFLFGDFKETEMEEIIKCSQFVQAESLRYAYESNRRRMFQCSGAMAWQLNEPWPNVSNTCIVDYYNEPKMAYYYVKDALECVKPNLRYDTLVWNTDATFEAQLYMLNEWESENFHIECKAYDMNDNVIYSNDFDCASQGNTCSKVADIKFKLENIKTAFKIKLTYNGKECNTDYLFLIEDNDYSARKQAILKHYDQFMKKTN